MRKRLFLIAWLFIPLSSLFAQDTLRLSRESCEAIFLRENLLLLAERSNISKAEAQVQQAKLWPNPALTIEQVNLWATPGQRDGKEVVPPLWNGVGANQQFAIELEQLIQTAGKRKKLIALEEIGIDKANAAFEELLRNLKIEFRKRLTELEYVQENQRILQRQLLSIRDLTSSYQKQVKLGNIPQNELIRLKAQELEIAQDLNNWQMQRNDIQQVLKTLMHLPSQSQLVIIGDDFTRANPTHPLLSFEMLIEKAKENRPDLRLSSLESVYADRLLTYERSKRTPDMLLKTNYDRNGSTMLNFVGFGVAFELPFFSRNQAQIKVAEVTKRQASIYKENLLNVVENDLEKALQNYLAASRFREQIDPEYVETLDTMLQAYTRNFQQKNISIVEYLDFLGAYLENQKSILEATKSVKDAAEELNYAAGTDIILLHS